MAKRGGGLDEALDELYASSPSEFTARRDALAKQLKASGDAAAAATVHAQRRPTQLAYVLNQVARRHADALAELVDVGRELARAQRKALRGEPGHDLREAIARQRSVVAGLTATTAALMGELGVATGGQLDDVAGALQAALVDPAVGAALEEGRLAKVPERVAAFGAVGGEADAGAGANAKADAKAEAKPTARERAEARADATAARVRIEEETERARVAAEAAAARARQQAASADAAEREADGRAAQAKALLDRARALDAEAKRLAADMKRVTREADATRHAADRAAQRAKHAAAIARRERREADRGARPSRSPRARA